MEVAPAPRSFPNAKTLLRRSGDMDYNDVFGGPPRRFSMQEMRGRYNIETAIEEEVVEEEEDRVSTPVFGEESTPRRRHPGGNFFDDIFGGDESYVSPRNRDRNNLLSSSPNSMLFSPTKPKSEHFGTSLPAQFSLPAKLNGVELPAFAAMNHAPNKMDISTNVLISPRTSTTLSRFSSQSIRSQEEARNEACLYRQSTLPREAFFTFEDSPKPVTSNEKETSPELKKERKSFDGNGSQFYYSIYRWASGRGSPMINFLGRNSPKSKDRIGKCASFNGRVESKPSIMGNGGLFAHTEPEHLKMESEKKDWSSKDEEKEMQNSVDDVVLVAQDVTSEAKQNKSKRGMSRAKIHIKEKLVKEVMNESPKSEVMPTLRSLLIAEAEQKGMEDYKTTPRKDQLEAIKNSNKNQGMGMGINVNRKSSWQAAAVDPEVSPEKRVAAGTVKEFIQVFNQEADSRRKADVHAQSESHRWEATGTDEKDNVNLNVEKVDENLKKDEVWDTQRKKNPSTETDNRSASRNTASSSGSIPCNSTTSEEKLDESFKDKFMVEQWSDHTEVTQGSEGSEHIQAIDVKIQQWSVGKTGNIRSLLSTLQYVLWPEIGWNPIPLADLIEVNSVKRAYQKALLRLHPDKLQQSSAASHHKYTAQKIFDILQEAWDHFNTLG